MLKTRTYKTHLYKDCIPSLTSEKNIWTGFYKENYTHWEDSLFFRFQNT